jgi:hypothetical protein
MIVTHLDIQYGPLDLDQPTDDPTCERCLEEDESATHIPCDCVAIANLRFRHLGQFFMEPRTSMTPP